jgi:hypothetical protein
MTFVDGSFYRVVPVKEIEAKTVYIYNKGDRFGSLDEFWEDFGCNSFYCTANKTSLIRNLFFIKIYNTLTYLDDNHIRYHKYGNPSDFVRKHLIRDPVTLDVILCNRHLFKISNKLNRRPFYGRSCFIKRVLIELFPRFKAGKNIPTDTPNWVCSVLLKKKDIVGAHKKRTII